MSSLPRSTASVTCAIGGCHDPVEQAVRHPGRPHEDVTGLCPHHADIAINDADAEPEGDR